MSVSVSLNLDVAVSAIPFLFLFVWVPISVYPLSKLVSIVLIRGSCSRTSRSCSRVSTPTSLSPFLGFTSLHRCMKYITELEYIMSVSRRYLCKNMPHPYAILAELISGEKIHPFSLVLIFTFWFPTFPGPMHYFWFLI